MKIEDKTSGEGADDPVGMLLARLIAYRCLRDARHWQHEWYVIGMIGVGALICIDAMTGSGIDLVTILGAAILWIVARFLSLRERSSADALEILYKHLGGGGSCSAEEAT